MEREGAVFMRVARNCLSRENRLNSTRGRYHRHGREARWAQYSIEQDRHIAISTVDQSHHRINEVDHLPFSISHGHLQRPADPVTSKSFSAPLFLSSRFWRNWSNSQYAAKLWQKYQASHDFLHCPWRVRESLTHTGDLRFWERRNRHHTNLQGGISYSTSLPLTFWILKSLVAMLQAMQGTSDSQTEAQSADGLPELRWGCPLNWVSFYPVLIWPSNVAPPFEIGLSGFHVVYPFPSNFQLLPAMSTPAMLFQAVSDSHTAAQSTGMIIPHD